MHIRRIHHGGAVQRHDHAVHELVYLEAGMVRQYHADGSDDLESGTFILLPPLAWHAYGPGRRLRYVNVLFDGRALLRCLHAVPDTTVLRSWLWEPGPPRPSVIRPTRNQVDAARRELLILMDLVNRQPPHWAAGAVLHLGSLLLALQDMSACPPATIDDPLVAECLRLIDRHYPEPLTTSSLADMLRVSREHLSRRVARTTGSPLRDHIERTRLEYAARQLLTSDANVLAIALDSGFQNASHFSRRFRQRLGCSPQMYRLRNRSQSAEADRHHPLSWDEDGSSHADER
ncbi:MAG: helix-turn-helix domain-containing protein [Planctomycetota bacterium]